MKLLLSGPYFRLHLTISLVGHAGIIDCRKLKNDFMVDPNSITSIPNFIRIRPSILEFNYADKQN
jgi:hypothetical protein